MRQMNWPQGQKPAAPAPYVHEEFPKWKHHQTPNGRSRLVHDPDQEDALGEGWGDFPYAPAQAVADEEPEPTAAPTVRKKAPKAATPAAA